MRKLVVPLLCIMVLLLSGRATAQTPVANRVKMAARTVASNGKVLAKYTDNERHCLFYLMQQRIYCYDVLTNETSEIQFPGEHNSTITGCALSPGSNFLVVSMKTGTSAKRGIANNRSLWTIDSRKRTAQKIESGFAIARSKHGYTIRRIVPTSQLTADHPATGRWVQNNYYTFEGKVKATGTPYVMTFAEILNANR